MMRSVIATAAAGSACVLVGAAPAPSGVEEAFAAFKARFGRNYGTDEGETKLAVFTANYHYVHEENAKGHPYTLGITEFADLTQEEFASTHFGYKRSRSSTSRSLGMHKRNNRTLPESVDWNEQGAVTPVKDQKSCGSCWAFSTTGALEGAWQIATGKLVPLSEQQLVDCSKENDGCSGGLMDQGFMYEEGVDICGEDEYPYEAADGKCHASGCVAAIPKHAVAGYRDVDPEDEEALMDAVAQQPVSIAIEADLPAFRLYKSGVLTATCGTGLDHGVLAVGYGEEDGEKYWLVKNSWGSDWGLGGFIKLARGKGKAGECGINKEPSYPVVSQSSVRAANGGHYGRPPCGSDEVQGYIPGPHCAPECQGSSSSCPQDVPRGTTARPICIPWNLDQYRCVLDCQSTVECPSGASCSVGICVWPSADEALDFKSLEMLQVSGEEIIV